MKRESEEAEYQRNVFTRRVDGSGGETYREEHFVYAMIRRYQMGSGSMDDDLRHTCATLQLGKVIHPKFIQEQLGHATIAAILDTYSRVMPGMGGQTA